MLYWKRWWWWLLAFWQRYSQIIIFTSLFVIFTTYITYRFNLLPQSGKKIALIGRYNLNQLPDEVSLKLSFGLTRNINGKISPGIAKKWQIKDQGKTYVFYLNDLIWHDGQKLKAKDLHFRIKNTQIQAIDDKTLAIKLKQSLASLPAFLTAPLFKSGLVGVGPYKVKHISVGRDKSLRLITLEQQGRSLSLLDKQITYVFYPSYNQAKTAFMLAELDVLPNLLSIEEFKSFPNIKIIPKVDKDKVVVLFFNLDNDYLQDKKFRQALAYATDKFESQYLRATGPFNPESFYYNPDVNRFDYNLDKAKTLFAKTAMATASAQEKIKLTLVTPAEFLSLAEKIKDSWQKINNRLIVKLQVSYETSPRFDALIKVQSIPLDPDQYFLWHSTQESNISRLKSARIDQFLEDGRKEISVNKRKEIYNNFQKYLVDEVPAVFLFQPTTYTIERQRDILELLQIKWRQIKQGLVISRK